MFCFKCGAEISDESDFCMKCGTEILHHNKTEIEEVNSISTIPMNATIKSAFVSTIIVSETEISYKSGLKSETIKVSDISDIRYTAGTPSENGRLFIKANGKSFSTINPFFKKTLSDSLQIMSELDMSYMDGTVCISSDKDIQRYRVARMKFFKEMMSYFLMSKVTARFPSKVSFIGKFLYLAEISFDKRYWLGYEPRPIRECKKYEILQYEHHSINGIEYVAIPFDVGKNIADTIKKCKDKPNVKNSFYYFNIPTGY